jgi:hypothetical protein
LGDGRDYKGTLRNLRDFAYSKDLEGFVEGGRSRRPLLTNFGSFLMTWRGLGAQIARRRGKKQKKRKGKSKRKRKKEAEKGSGKRKRKKEAEKGSGKGSGGE